MANYPLSFDNFTNPTSVDSLSAPSHSLQHADANDAIEALETKLGLSASPAGSATAGHVLVAQTAGTTSWTTVGASAINTTGGSAGQYLSAGTAGVATWAAVPVAGLTLISTQTLSASSGVSFSNVIDSTYTHYRIVFSLVGSEVCNVLFRARVNTTDVTTGYYGANYSVSHTGGSTIVNQQNTGSYNLINTEDSTLSNRRSIMGIDFSTSGNLISFGGSGFSGRQLGAFISGGICLDAANPVTGFTIYPSSGTLSGTIALYGYKKSV
jgi:hypothetical protein